MKGNFIISLDFELMWGVLDKRTEESYGTNIQAVHLIIPRLLDLFEKYNIKTTFSSVGMLHHATIDELKETLPKSLPKYNQAQLSSYHYFEKINNPQYYFAPDLLKLIQQKGHEVGTHTYSHYYCLEEGQTIESFECDLQLAKNISEKNNFPFKTLVFPRNQYNKDYLSICYQEGLKAFRGNEKSWMYKASQGKDQNPVRRILRLVDSYINISGHNIGSIEKEGDMLNISASRFLRPYSPKLRSLSALRLRRITKSMTKAAEKNKIFHLWWHPHNFGSYTDENFIFLEKILKHFSKLNDRFGMESHSMLSLVKKINGA